MSHRLFHLQQTHPDDAAAELRSLLGAAGGEVASVAGTLKLTPKTVHGWITAWGLRAWLEETFPRAERQRKGWAKGRAGMGTKGAQRRETTDGTEGVAPQPSTCSACGRPLDPESADIVARHPADFPHGALGACCHGKKGEEDHGWGEAPEHGHDF